MFFLHRALSIGNALVSNLSIYIKFLTSLSQSCYTGMWMFAFEMIGWLTETQAMIQLFYRSSLGH